MMHFVSGAIRTANNHNNPYEVDVKNGLSYTPSQMASLTAQGKATSLESLAGFVDNRPLADNEPLPIEFRRGVDMNDAYEAEKHSRGKIKRLNDSVARGSDANTSK